MAKNNKAIKTSNSAVAFLSSVTEINLDNNEIQLTPDGQFNARDGRPVSCKCWVMNETIAQRVIASLSKRKNKIAIDYEHQTLKTEINGQPADAAGWFLGANVVYRAGEGLFATKIEWTAEARSRIQDKKYLYISPVIIYDSKSGEILDIYNAALTNDPAIDGMNEVTLAAASNTIIQNLTNTGDESMDEKIRLLLIKLLGLDADATDEQILAALEQIESETSSDAASSLITLLADKNKQIADLTGETGALKTSVAALKTANSGAGSKVIAELSAELNKLKLQISTEKKAQLIDGALSCGKLVPAQTKWAESLSTEDLSAYLEHAPVIADLSNTQTGGKAPSSNTHGLTEHELEAAALSGLTPEEFAVAKKENA